MDKDPINETKLFLTL